MGWAQVGSDQYNTWNGSTFVTSASFSYTVTAGTDLVVFSALAYAQNSGEASTISVSGLGATWTTVLSYTNTSTQGSIYTIVGSSPTAGAGTLSITFSFASAWSSDTCDFSGGTTTVDVTATGTSSNAPSVTTTVAGDLVLATRISATNASQITGDTGWTNFAAVPTGAGVSALGAAFQVQSAAGATSLTTTNGNAGDQWAVVALQGGGGSTSLTLFETATNDTLLTTARTLTPSAPASESSVAATGQLAKNGTGWIELFAQGGTGTTLAGSQPTVSGNGFIWDATTLEGQQIVAGNWTPTVKLSCPGGSFVASIHVRIFKRSSGGVYTQFTSGGVATDLVKTGVTISTAAAAVFAATSLDAMTFATGDKVYFDITLDITTGNSNNTAANRVISLYENGGSSDGVVTPGYQASVVAIAYSPLVFPRFAVIRASNY